MIVGVPPVSSLGRGIVVVSPHFDDGVLSLGASIAPGARQGASRPAAHRPRLRPRVDRSGGRLGPPGWLRHRGRVRAARGARRIVARARRSARRRCGSRSAASTTNGTATTPRSATPSPRRSPTRSSSSSPAIRSPIRITRGSRGLSRGRARSPVALYAEQPYTRRSGAAAAPRRAESPRTTSFEPVHVTSRDRLAKWRAIRRYRSQLPLLGMRRSLRGGPHRYALVPSGSPWAPADPRPRRIDRRPPFSVPGQEGYRGRGGSAAGCPWRRRRGPSSGRGSSSHTLATIPPRAGAGGALAATVVLAAIVLRGGWRSSSSCRF